MFKRILIANRGEIACRLIRACRELQIETVAVYSQADSEALHVQLADYAVCIGKNISKESYLNVENILSAAVLTGSQAIHPGFGFLSENPKFAKMCEECQVKFIGPSAHVIQMMGDKAQARKQMMKAGVPVIPGSDGVVPTVEEGLKIAEKIGFPLLIKAVAGGGGKGIRKVQTIDEFEKQFLAAQQEALQGFGNEEVYIERIIYPAKHIEFQILGDSHGNVVHLGERDCSLQRKNQKIIEEAPSPYLDDELREKMGEAAVKAAEYIGYEGVGTIEFLVDKHRNFYFMEMNTRIQVEHPITEQVIGYDLVKEQIKLAAGEKLSGVNHYPNMHSIECRINAEDPYNDFRPSPGKITGLNIPGGHGVRVDTHVYSGYTIPSNYDSMIAKLIVTAKTRPEAIAKMKRALDEFYIEGVKTTIPFHRQLMDNEDFIKGDYTTKFMETFVMNKDYDNNL